MLNNTNYFHKKKFKLLFQADNFKSIELDYCRKVNTDDKNQGIRLVNIVKKKRSM